MRLGSLFLSGALCFSVPPSQHHVRGIFWRFFTLKLARFGEVGWAAMGQEGTALGRELEAAGAPESLCY